MLHSSAFDHYGGFNSVPHSGSSYEVRRTTHRNSSGLSPRNPSRSSSYVTQVPVSSRSPTRSHQQRTSVTSRRVGRSLDSDLVAADLGELRIDTQIDDPRHDLFDEQTRSVNKSTTKEREGGKERRAAASDDKLRFTDDRHNRKQHRYYERQTGREGQKGGLRGGIEDRDEDISEITRDVHEIRRGERERKGDGRKDRSGRVDDRSGRGDDRSGRGDDRSGRGDDRSGRGDDRSGRGEDRSGSHGVRTRRGIEVETRKTRRYVHDKYDENSFSDEDGDMRSDARNRRYEEKVVSGRGRGDMRWEREVAEERGGDYNDRDRRGGARGGYAVKDEHCGDDPMYKGRRITHENNRGHSYADATDGRCEDDRRDVQSRTRKGHFQENGMEGYDGRRWVGSKQRGRDEEDDQGYSDDSASRSFTDHQYSTRRDSPSRSPTSPLRSPNSPLRSPNSPLKSPNIPLEPTQMSQMYHVPIEVGGSSSDDRTLSEVGQGRRIREILPENDQEPVYVYKETTGHGRRSSNTGQKRFLKSVQSELDRKRMELKGEVDRLTQGSAALPAGSTSGGSNSFVDSSTGVPIFKAFFDVSEYPINSVSVSIDKITSKIVVYAKEDMGAGGMRQSFTQKVQLPRFADESRLVSKITRKGILKVQVPLLYYFNKPKDSESKSNSFIQEIKTNPRSGVQTMEVVVNAGTGVSTRDLHVQVEENQLQVTADVKDKYGQKATQLIKNYTLPELANVDRITSRLENDGRLIVSIPLNRVDPNMLSPAISEALSSRSKTKTIKHEVSRQRSYTFSDINEDPIVSGSRYNAVERTAPVGVVRKRTEVRDDHPQTLPREMRYTETRQERHRAQQSDTPDGGYQRIRVVKTRRARLTP